MQAERMIVKVQMPIVGDEALVYNADRSVWVQQEAGSLVHKMGRSLKRFFFADLVDGYLVVEEPAPWQEW